MISFKAKAAIASAFAAAIAATSPAALAQAWPTKAVHIVVPFAAGTSPDVVMRIVGPKLSEKWGQPVLVENRTGAAGNIGAQNVATATPDGHTLLYTVNSVICANPHLYSRLPFDTFKSFAPVSLVVNLGYVLLVKDALPARNLQELFALAKAEPGKLNYSSAGEGSGNHIVMELLSISTGLKMQHIPMSTNPTASVISGEVDLHMSPFTTGIPASKGGRVRALGVTSAKRSEALPDVPAIGELVPGYVGDAWHGMLSPAGTPAAVNEKIAADIATVLAMPDVRKRLTDIGLSPVGSTPAELAAILRNDYDKWGKVIRGANIKLD